MPSNDYSPYDPAALPPVIARYLDAQSDHTQRGSIADAFAEDARVTDEGIEHLGRDAIREWLTHAASEYTYTTSFIGQRPGSADQWVVLARLEGNFPGGVADVRFQVTSREGLITHLLIAP